jgi:hypothetical protein
MDKSTKTVIGKDVIESLTSGMYDDSRFIYREYIQNSADQIDRARQQGLIIDGEVHISIEASNGLIVIEDDATGIESSKVVEILKNIAQSTKTRGIDKGFRGIGRLGGLGYCEKLIFETSFKGESVKSILTWDALKLKEIINDRDSREEASQVIDSVTSLEISEEQVEKHYFKVTLIGVKNKVLLDVPGIRTYLSMVAPVPFNPSFLYSGKIYRELENEGISIDEYKIFINTEQVFKGYNSNVYEGDINNKKIIGKVIDVNFFKEFDSDNNILFWGWYGITEKTQSLNQVNFARGFRLRKSNIQIGNEDTLTKLHRDKRFQFYFLGEVYGLHKDLIPNARRDYFSETKIFFEFEQKLRQYFHTTIHNFCYAASDVNAAVKKISEYNQALAQFEKKNNDGFVDRNEHEDEIILLRKKEENAIKAKKKLKSIKTKSSTTDTNIPIAKIIERVESTNTLEIDKEISIGINKKPTLRTDKLSKLNKQERKFLGNIFSIIRNVMPKDTADALILKIEEEYK